MVSEPTWTSAPAPAPPAPARGAVALAVAAVVVGAATVAGLYVGFVRTRTGQRLDQSAFLHVHADSGLTTDITGVLDDATIGIAVTALVVGMAVALVRGHLAGAIAAAVLVGGSNVTTQVLKHGWLTRPDLGYEWTNSLPSGHTTVALSVVMAMLLVLPGRLRSLLVLGGCVGANLVGVGVVVGGWHRPSDVLAAAGVCLAWAGLVSLGLLWTGGPAAGAAPAPCATRGSAVAAFAGAAVVVVLAVGARPDDPDVLLFEQVAIVAALALGTALCLALAARLLPADH
jgi:membrane-associated phospholipid phosphatase